MPAITLGLAEVEERLHALRRRLNGVTAQHGAYVGTSTVILVLTALIIVALRGPASVFRMATWGGVLVLLGVTAWCLRTVRRGWLDLAATAHFADRRGALTDRLVTLVDLRVHPRPSRLAPVLVAQVLALSQQWQPQRIARRRVPRSVYAVLGALLALGCTAFIERRPPAPAAAFTPGGSTAGAVTSVSPKALLGSGGTPGGQASDGPTLPGAPPPDQAPQGRASSGGHPASGQPPRGEAARDGTAGDQSRAATHAPHAKDAQGNQGRDEQPRHTLAALPDRLQEAIRRAFHAEPMDRPQQLAARAESKTDDPAGRTADAQSNPDAQRETSDTKRDAKGQGPQKEPGPGSQKGPGKPKPGVQTAQQPSADAPNRSFDGNSPAAGEGSSPAGLTDGGQGQASAAGPAAPKTFKLTITSFLHAMEQKGVQPRQPGKRVATTGGVGARGGSQVALNERQLNDDALRKAEIPPEYEEIVRRVYSLRADQ